MRRLFFCFAVQLLASKHAMARGYGNEGPMSSGVAVLVLILSVGYLVAYVKRFLDAGRRKDDSFRVTNLDALFFFLALGGIAAAIASFWKLLRKVLASVAYRTSNYNMGKKRGDAQKVTSEATQVIFSSSWLWHLLGGICIHFASTFPERKIKNIK
jgi:hypothetical protein